VVLAAPAINLGQQFRILRTDATLPQANNKAPHQTPPFTHWDLREFAACQVSWVLGTAPVPDLDRNGTADQAADRTLAQDTFAAAFARWDVIMPGRLDVVNVGPGAPAGGFATDGFNTLSFDPAALGDPSVLGVTRVDRNVASGVIIEADIVFNSLAAPNPRVWVFKADGAVCDNDEDFPPLGNFPAAEDDDWNGNGVEERERDLPTVSTHEIGHFLGLGHIDPLGGSHNVAANAIMEELWTIGIGPRNAGHANQTLKNQDMDGFNFLYCPDLGDAPHKDDAFSIDFSSNVHGSSGGRVLNGQNLRTPIAGPAHLLGIKPRQAARNFTYEWIGTAVGSDLDSECEARVVDMDRPFDDGVRFDPDPPRVGRKLYDHR
jgi:hypothetical protein